MEKITSLCKRRGFIFQNSEIYGGLASTWDYGPLGVELKRNVKEAWWASSVYERDDIAGLDAAILMHPKAWQASGHVKSFFDLLVDCKNCKKRFKLEDLTESGKKKIGQAKCPNCAGTSFTEQRPFNLMFKTFLGPVEETGSQIYLRPETAQGIFVNFNNVLNSTHKKLPFGIAQIGKAFRNEVTTGNFTFRSREFEQMEIEYFVRPPEANKWYKYWIKERFDWYVKLGINPDNLRIREHKKDELAHYAKACADIEYKFPFGWAELEGIANRTDFDLKQHANLSGKDLNYFEQDSKERLVPYIIEPSGGVDRTMLAFLIDAYREEEVRERKRVVLGLDKRLSPIKVAVLPLLKNRAEIVKLAKSITDDLRKNLCGGGKRVVYDDTAAIGRLYRRQDEVGTIFCVTVDVDSLQDKKVTVRQRDSMEQERISIENLKNYLGEKLQS
ncbi:MAG: glycine--tRNA ligase [Candidatus Omnitrophota bacterium]|nr:MAG: glycine--tRNA ligase [Candidatus Omnitrophota bacterium]